jgi:hypothetical protein
MSRRELLQSNRKTAPLKAIDSDSEFCWKISNARPFSPRYRTPTRRDAGLPLNILC